MKIKHDFVTNSSSTSFVIYGATFQNYEDAAALKEKISDKEFVTECGEYEDTYVGVDFTSMKMDETRRQFQERVEKVLRDAGYTGKCGLYIEGYYNG